MLIGQDTNLKGSLGYKGERGYSAYEIAVQNGFLGTEEEWLETLGTLDHNTVEFKSNKTTTVSSSSTDVQYPSAKATYDAIQQQSFTYTGDTLPIGATIEWFSNTIPTNWLLLNGQAISRTDFSELFTLYGTTFGVGNGSTTFNIPDMRDYVPVGKSSTDTNIDTIGEKYGTKTHTLSINEMPSHNHSLNGYYGNLDGAYNIKAGNNAGTVADISTGYNGGGLAHNNMQPSIATNFIVKAKQSSGLIANVAQAFSTSNTDSYSCSYINDKQSVANGKQYMLVTISSNFTMSIGSKIPFNTVVANTTNGKLSLNNNNIIIGNGVSKVRVSGALFNDVQTINNGQYTFAMLKWQGVDLNSCIVPLCGNYITNTINPKIQDVTSGNIIYLLGDCTGNSRARSGHANTYLLVEIVE